MAGTKVIVFGPTGAVGSAAARTAHDLGAHVVLAMRDTNKSIRGLDAEQEKQGNFERVHADLEKPDTVREAVQKTKAKHAFIYMVHHSSDHQKACIEALKSAGIELVVFLSSYTVYGDPKDFPQSEYISYVHAQVELVLDEVYGADKYVALRPGYFASNTTQYKSELSKGGVKIYKPKTKVDCIVPEDIGRVGGTVLAKGPQDGQRKIYLYGPELVTQESMIQTLGKATGKQPKLEEIDEEAAIKQQQARGLPPPVAKYLVDLAGRSAEQPAVMGISIKEEHLSNVEKYSGKPATTFEEWATQNKHLFEA